LAKGSSIVLRLLLSRATGMKKDKQYFFLTKDNKCACKKKIDGFWLSGLHVFWNIGKRFRQQAGGYTKSVKCVSLKLIDCLIYHLYTNYLPMQVVDIQFFIFLTLQF